MDEIYAGTKMNEIDMFKSKSIHSSRVYTLFKSRILKGVYRIPLNG